jgi:multisubunit Na+/H+ antiporter MnhB subunit
MPLFLGLIMYFGYNKYQTMNAALLFKTANAFVIPGWLLLLLLPNWKYTLPLIRYGMVVVLAALYAYLILSSISGFNSESFSTLENVKHLFQNDNAVLAGWIHYLAFDLMIGTFIVEQAKLHQVPRWLCVFALPFTFMFGPMGYLLFVIMKSFKGLTPQKQIK